MSKLESMMEAAQAEDAAADPTPEPAAEEDATGAPNPPGDEGADAAAVDSEAAKPAAPAASPVPSKDDKAAARFAALAREKERSLALKSQVEANARALQQREADISARESALTARVADAEKILSDPDRLFAHLESAFGIRNLDDLRKHAQGVWERPKPAPKEEDPSKRPLTHAEYEQLQRETQQAQAQRRAADDFVRIIDTEDEAGESKYEAAAVLYSPEERVRHGDRIASQLAAKGIPFSLDDVADALNELALSDPRYAKLQKRAAKQGAPTATSKPAAPAAATKAPVTNGRQSSQARTLNNDVATERANGAAPRLSHRERLQRLMSS